MKTKITSFTLATLAFAKAATIVNADFELDNYNPGGNSLVSGTSVYSNMPFPITRAVYQWQYTTVSSSPDGFHDIPGSPLPSAGYANSGDQYIEFTGPGSTASFELYGQIIGLTPGTLYSVSFWHQNNTIPTAPLPIAEIWDATAWAPATGAFSLLSATASATTAIPVNLTPMTWNQSTFSFTANTPEAVIRFSGGADHHLYLDDLSITSTPEPSQTLLCAFSSLLLLRRKRN